MKPMGAKMKKQTKQNVIDQLQILEGITLQMYRLLDSLERANALDHQLAPLVGLAMNEYMDYIKEQV
jgi:hypothetical protein